MFVTEETKDSLLVPELGTVLSVATANKTSLNLDSAALAELGKVFGDYQSSYNAAVTEKGTLKSVVATKNANKKAAKALVAKYAKTWRANPAIPNSLLDALLMPNHNTQGSSTPPTTPQFLPMEVSIAGVVTLKWQRNGNNNTTIFNVETAESLAGPWTFLDSTTKTKLDYSGTPGTQVCFRVVAKRNGQTSSYSVPITLWGGGNGAALKVAA
ncbi:MAG: fibronectin type III domain-containing protein [Armatimonadetes bacterium]|nr:fibronectin type III domain-containing protein [Armatimonadota bacterium]